jgi:hypothetical protein
VHELPGTKGRWMACQNLLDQRGTGARHADNEHRYNRGITELPLCAHQLGGEDLPDTGEPVKVRSFVVDDPLPFERIGLEQTTE